MQQRPDLQTELNAMQYVMRYVLQHEFQGKLLAFLRLSGVIF